MAKLSPEPVFLGLLEAQTSYGYHLLDQFRSTEQLGRIWNLGSSQLYALLKRLERDGLIDGREEFRPDAPMRTMYWLTDQGRDQLFRWLNDPHPSASTRHIRTEFLSRLYIANLLGEPPTPIIDAQVAACQAEQTRLSADTTPRLARIAALALDLRRREMEVILAWLESCRPVPRIRPTARRQQRP